MKTIRSSTSMYGEAIPMYIPRYPTLWPNNFLGNSKSPQPFPLGQHKIFFYNLSRTAIFDAIKILKLSHGDKILLPSYICFNVIIPFLENGIDVVYYKINQDLKLDKEDIEEKIKKGAKALFFVHYFGFPQDITYLKLLRDRYSIILIEDCAHAFLSEINGFRLGDLGDVSIFSLRKSVPVHNVGILLVKSPHNKESCVSPKRVSFSVYKGIGGRLLNNFKFRSGITFPAGNLRTMRMINKFGIMKEQFNQSFPKGYGMGMMNKMLLRNLNYEKIKGVRRSNYKYLLDNLINREEIIPMFKNLPDGVCPMCFPIMIENRDEVCKNMNVKGIDVFPWPFLPYNLGDEYQITHLIANKILLLPIHQDLKIKHLDSILSLLEKSINNIQKVKEY